jgi:hypothetical protein
MTSSLVNRPQNGTGVVRASALDHFVIVVRDLPASRAAFERLGFHMTERGDHEGWGTANHLAVLDRQYLELWGEHGEGPDTQLVRDLAARHEGLWQVGLKTPNADLLHANLTGGGIPMEAPYDYARPIEINGARRSVGFRIVYIAESVRLPLRMFLCEQRTPDLIWRPEWQRHANRAKMVRELVLASHDPWDEANNVARLVDADLESASSTEAVLRLADGRIRFQHQPTGQSSAERGLPGLRLVIQTESLADAAVVLRQASVPITVTPDRIQIPAAYSCGIAFDLVESYAMGA